MKNAKTILLLVIIALLIGSMLFLVYLIQNGDDPIALLNSRASDDSNVEDLFAPTTNPNAPDAVTNTPSPTIIFQSTSPTPNPSGTISGSPTPSTATSTTPTLTPTRTPTLTPRATATSSPTPSVIGQTTISPTVITQLPVAGAKEEITKLILGGGSLLIIIALFL